MSHSFRRRLIALNSWHYSILGKTKRVRVIAALNFVPESGNFRYQTIGLNNRYAIVLL